MSLSLSRRLATPLIAAAAATGLVLGVTNGVAAADPPQSSNSVQDKQLLLSKEVVGSNVVLPGASVTYRTTIAYTTANGVGNAPLSQLSIAYLREVPPAGWVNTARSLSYAGGGGTWATQDGGQKVTCSSGCTFLVGGYVIKSGQSAVLTTTYTVPAGTAPGVYDSGAFSAQPNTWSGGERGSNTFGAFVQVADPTVATTTTLNVPGTATVGQSVALTANVGPANSVGTVQFKDGGVDIGGPVTVSGGNATLNHTFTTAGNHDITAAFTAGAGFHNSASGVQTVAVSLAESTTTLNVPATAHTDEAVDLTANVVPAGATGTVQFKDGATDIGGPVPVNAGAATLNHTFTTVGNHDITAVYSGDATHGPSTSAVSAVDVSVKVVDTTISLTAPATSSVGQAVDLTATVVPAEATGTVQFKDGATDIGGPVPVNAGAATLNHTFTTVGNHDITAVYSGDATHNPSTSTVSAVDVTVVGTTTGLSAPATAVTGAAVDLVASVDPANATGTVEFKDGDVVLGTAPVTGGTATLSHTFTTAGSHSITAAYSGDASNAPSASAASVVDVSVAVVDTTTTLNVPATAKTGTAVDLTATVSPAEATGTVEFKDGATVLGTAPVTGGTATLNHTFTADGAHSITAVYSGAEGFATSTSAPGTVDVSTDPVVVDTTTTLSVPATAVTGNAVDLTATVSPAEATGTVEFKDGATVLGTAPVTAGTATLNHTFTTAGSHSITAVYSGAEGFNGSSSTAGTVSVTDPAPGDVATVTTLEAPSSAATADLVTLTATVKTDAGAPVANGTVRFFDGATQIGEVVADADGKAVLTHAFVTTGARQVTAVFTGEPGFTGSTSAAATITVADPGTPGGSGSSGSLENIFGS
ncbi:beta strand repeat-containing protein [Rhodococcus gannanensis]|uniref:Beta strand repeat-containing protein n=1 Tax=Rhodococcus gannanensis TaxID=1960308 RepID=A0ABW4P0A3_9NOCA